MIVCLVVVVFGDSRCYCHLMHLMLFFLCYLGSQLFWGLSWRFDLFGFKLISHSEPQHPSVFQMDWTYTELVKQPHVSEGAHNSIFCFGCMAVSISAKTLSRFKIWVWSVSLGHDK